MSEWINVCAGEDIPDEEVIGVQVAGRELAIYRVNGEIFATEGVCNHGNARLCDGYLEGHEIECPLHQGRFDIRTGKAMCAPLTANIRVFPVQGADGRVFVDISQVN